MSPTSRRTRRASVTALGLARQAVAGYTICNDIGGREIQRLEMESPIGITVSKNFPSFGPTGPWIVAADAIPGPQALTMELKVNGEQRQHSSNADMIFSVTCIIAYWYKSAWSPAT